MPAESVFWTIIATNIINIVLTLIIMKGYVNFSMSLLFRGTFLPVIIVGLLTVIAPIVICRYFSSGILRLVVNICAIEVVLLVTSWMFAIRREEKQALLKYVNKKIK